MTLEEEPFLPPPPPLSMRYAGSLRRLRNISQHHPKDFALFFFLSLSPVSRVDDRGSVAIVCTSTIGTQPAPVHPSPKLHAPLSPRTHILPTTAGATHDVAVLSRGKINNHPHLFIFFKFLFFFRPKRKRGIGQMRS